MSTNDANNTPKPRLVLDDPTSSSSFKMGMTFSEQQARIKKYSELLETLGKGLLHTGLVFTCKIGGLPESTFQVTQFDLNEGLSELFTLSIHAVSEQNDIDFSNQLGVASSLTVSRDGKTLRTVQGLLASAEQGNTDGIKTWYQFVIRPEMWVMTLNQDSRIFQNKTVPQILQQLLDEAHIKYDKQFYQPELHQTRRYITQKRESAYAFWCRLAFEEGINFWFEAGPKLFYSDNHLGMTAGISLTYNPQAETDITDTTATTWRYTERLCSDVRIDKDYNPLRPSYPLSQETTGEVHQQHPVFESYGRFQEDAHAQPLNQLRYEQSQNHRQTGSASTNCFTEIAGDDHLIMKGTQKSLIEGDVSLQIKGAKHSKIDDELIVESGIETSLKSGGKIILEAGTEITLKVGSSFIRLTPSAIFTSGNLDIGSSGPGTGQSPIIQLPDGVIPFEQPPYVIKKYCAVQAQMLGSWIIKEGSQK